MKRAAGLSQSVGGDVTKPIRLHVLAKRYFCTVDPAYRELLFPALVTSFKLQGSLLSAEEILRFELNPFPHDAIRLRRSDDGAKLADMSVPKVPQYIPILHRSTMSSIIQAMRVWLKPAASKLD